MVMCSRLQALIEMPLLTSQECGGDKFGALCFCSCQVVLAEQWLKIVGLVIVNFSCTLSRDGPGK